MKSPVNRIMDNDLDSPDEDIQQILERDEKVLRYSNITLNSSFPYRYLFQGTDFYRSSQASTLQFYSHCACQT